MQEQLETTNKLKSQLEAAGPASSHMIRALTRFAAHLSLPGNAFKLTIILYGLSNGRPLVKSSLLGLLGHFDKNRIPPDVETDKRSRHRAVEFMSRQVRSTLKAYGVRGYGYLFEYTPGHKDEETGKNVTSEFYLSLFDFARCAVEHAYSIYENKSNWRGMNKTIDATVDEMFSQLPKRPMLEESKSQYPVGNQIKSVIGRLRNKAIKLQDDMDARGLAHLLYQTEQLVVELKVMQQFGKFDSSTAQDNNLTMYHGAAGGGGDVYEIQPDPLPDESLSHELRDSQETESLIIESDAEGTTLASERLDFIETESVAELEQSVHIASQAIEVFEKTHLSTIAASWLDDTRPKGEQCVGFDPPEPFRTFKRHLVSILARHLRERLSVTFRPQSIEGYYYVQLDDLTSEQLEQLTPYSFIAWRSSAERLKQRCYQAWLCIENGNSQVARRIKQTLAFPVDKNASGSARLPGSLNLKPEYGPDFPQVEIVFTAPGRTISIAELEQEGLLVKEEKPPKAPRTANSITQPSRNRQGHWPDYNKSLEKAARKADDSPDRSQADWNWCMLASSWGFEVEEIADRLLEVSQKARDGGKGYALATADRAAKAVRNEL